MFLHVKDMARNGHKKVIVRTVDTDVLVIAISLFNQFRVEELWIDFGSGKHRKYFAIQQLSVLLANKAQAILFFHEFTGCDRS